MISFWERVGVRVSTSIFPHLPLSQRENKLFLKQISWERGREFLPQPRIRKKVISFFLPPVANQKNR
jgi:hypothetical protein